MKKYLSIILIFAILFGFSACGRVGQGIAPEEQSPPTDSQSPESSGQTDEGGSSASRPQTDEGGPQQGQTEKPPSEGEGGSLSVRFFDVGQGDAALILCGGKSMLIDGGEPSASDIIYTCLKKAGITHLDYIVCTHADEDHVGGLSGALSAVSVGAVLAPKTEADTRAYQSFKQKVYDQGLQIKHPGPGTSFDLGGSTVHVLGPISEDTSERNNTSLVLKIEFGSTSFLFTGDAEFDEEHDILEQGYDLSADVLKVSHHGSAGATSYRFLREVMPEYAVISVGKNNTYGHPTEEVLSRLSDAGVKVYRTDLQGDIIAQSDGTSVTITPSKNADIDTLSPSDTQDEIPDESLEGYIGNKNTKKFHLPSCHTLPAEQNRVYFATRDEAINSGYDPCKNCDP